MFFLQAAALAARESAIVAQAAAQKAGADETEKANAEAAEKVMHSLLPNEQSCFGDRQKDNAFWFVVR